MREMKCSGTDWLGMVPASWSVERTKYHFYNEKTVVGMYVDEYQRLALTMKGVIKRSKEDANGLQPEKFDSYQILRKNELVFKLIDLQNVTTSRIGLSPYDGIVSPAYIILKAKGDVTPAFAEKYFMFLWKNEIFNFLGNDGVRSSLNSSDLLNLPIVIPSVEEQDLIVDYLDRECAEIDASIEAIQESIDTLQRLKESTVSSVVTKGFDSHAHTKESGVAWCPEIPETWEIIPAKYLFHNSDKRMIDGDVQLTASQKYGIISQEDYMERENAKIVLATQNIESWKHVEPNDFVISLRSFQGGLEMSEITGCITWHYVVLKASRDIYYRYYRWLFKSAQYINALQGTCNFIRDGQDLRFSNFSMVPLLVPPIEEQAEIAKYLDEKIGAIDSLIMQKTEQLSVLGNYKKAIICEYVTGKKEVPVNG